MINGKIVLGFSSIVISLYLYMNFDTKKEETKEIKLIIDEKEKNNLNIIFKKVIETPNKSLKEIDNMKNDLINCKKQGIKIICSIEHFLKKDDEIEYKWETVDTQYDKKIKKEVIKIDRLESSDKRVFLNREGKWIFSFKKNGKIIGIKKINTKDFKNETK